jgi:ABC-type antimicrobial peptide transport system permease subunit
MLGKRIPSLADFPLYFIAFPVLLTLVIGIIAGLYPAFVLSAMKSVESLKGKLTTVREKVVLRKSLVAFQFGTATIVFAGAIIISSQIQLFFSKDLGFNKDYMVSVQVPRNWSAEGVRHMETIRKQFSDVPGVSNISLSFEVPDGNSAGNISIYRVGTDSTTAVAAKLLMTDEHYAATYNIPMVAGMFFTAAGGVPDTSKIVINAAQAKALGWDNPADAIGRPVKFPGSASIVTIAGVTKDFHFGSMQQLIQPAVFLHVGLTNTYRVLSFKLRPGNISDRLASLQKKWSLVLPGAPFQYTFMDDSLKKLYRTEIQLKQASYTATVLSIIIVLLGVLGLVALSVQKRTKEIGIRKVLGASLQSIISLFMKEFLLVICIAGIIACPVAWYLMNNWLNDYAYRIKLTGAPFIVSICALGLFTGLLIIVQTLKAGLDNPVKSLRTE